MSISPTMRGKKSPGDSRGFMDNRDYWKSCNTDCGFVLACASMAVAD
jgi:hypothetical protein